MSFRNAIVVTDRYDILITALAGYITTFFAIIKKSSLWTCVTQRFFTMIIILLSKLGDEKTVPV